MPDETTSAVAAGLPDRRLFLATGAAAVVASAVRSPAHAAERSALLGLIERHRAAREAFRVAADVQEEVEGRYEAAYQPVLTPGEPGCSYELRYGYDFCKDGIARGFEEQRKKMTGLARLDPAAAQLALAAIDAKEAERIATLDENFAAFEAQREAFGLAGADRQYQEASTAENASALALLAYPCRTIEEVRAKVAYLLASPLKDELQDAARFETFLKALVDASESA